jgi:CheY-like chemotaxis protein
MLRDVSTVVRAHRTDESFASIRLLQWIASSRVTALRKKRIHHGQTHRLSLRESVFVANLPSRKIDLSRRIGRQTWKDGSVVHGQRVLIVDGMHEIQQVLETVLAPRGLRVDWVRTHVQSIQGERADQPDILVIDAEASPLASAGANRVWKNVPQVILGSDEENPKANARHAHLSKPFQFPELIRAIERLLPAKSVE